MVDHRIVILGDIKKVRQGTQIVATGDNVSWEAHDTDARVIFPDGKCPFAQSKISVPKGGVSQNLAVTGNADRYPYSVYLLSTDSFAAGDSDPIIIVRK